MKKQFAALFAAACILTTASARAATQPKPFSYRVKAPAGAVSCADHAAAVAANFAVATRAKSKQVSGACESRQTVSDQGLSFSVDVLIVNYLSDQEITPDRSVFGANGSYSGDQSEAQAGVFKTYAECLQQIAAQQPIFIGETGVQPLTAYCTASTQQFFPGYSMTIESFGERKHRLYTFSEDSVGVVTDDHSQVIHAAAQAVQTAGGHIAWSNDSRFFYYHDGAIPVASENLGLFDDATQCTSQLGQAKAIFTQAGIVGVSTFCQIRGAGTTYSDAILMMVGAGSDEVQDTEADRYDSFAECMSDLHRVLQNSVSSGRLVYGGLCSPNIMSHSGYNAHVFIGYN